MADFIIVTPLLLIFLGNGLSGYGQVYNWDGSTGDAWFNPSNWVGNASPSGINGMVIFNNNARPIVGYNMNGATAIERSIANISFGTNATTSRTIKNSSTTVAGSLTLNTNPIITNSSSANHIIANGAGLEMDFGIQLGNLFNNIINTDGTGDISIGCIISGANPLTKSGIGNGVLNLSPANTYTGKTTITSSFINATDESAFGANPAGFVADQITLNGGGIQATLGNITFSSNRGITIGAVGGTFNVATTRTITALNIITGSGALNITGAGTGLVLMTGQHTYTGATIISSGSLQLNRTVGNTIPVTNNVVINGGTLNVTTNQTLNNLNINSGFLNIAAGATLTINGTLTYNGGTINSTGTIAYGSSGKLIYNAGTTTGIEWTNTNLPTDVTLNNTAIVTLANNASASGNLTINNTARLVGTAFALSVGGDWNSSSTNVSAGAGYTGGVGIPGNSSIVILNGSGIRSINHAGGAIFRNLNISGSGYYTANNNINISVNTLNISNGTLDMLINTINGSGNLNMTNGSLKSAKLNTTLPEFTGTYSITGGTIELYGAGTQELLGSKSYANLTFSNSGTKTLSSAITGANTITGTVLISGSVTLDVSTRAFGGTGTNLTMTGTSKYVTTGGGTNPDARGAYSLSNTSTIEFGGSSATDIYLAPAYANVDVSGSNVNLSGSNSVLNMKALTTFTVKTGGAFNVKSTNGFSGALNSAVGSANNPTITLEANSTVNYDGATQVITNQIPYQNISLSGTGIKNAPISTLSILGNLNKSSTCTFAHNNGTVSIDGLSAFTQTYTSITPVMEFCKLTNNNTAGGFTINGDLGVDSLLTLSDNSKLIFGSGNLNIRSSPLRTGAVGQISPATAILINYTGLGRFQIERYLYPQKSWRFLSVPLLKLAQDINSPTINASWREGGTNLNTTNYGTRITGPGTIALPNGVDEFTQRNSMKFYDMTSNKYIEIKSADLAANKTIANDEGYYVFVRGDRGIDVPAGAAGATTLRARGQIRTGNQTYNVTGLKFQSVGNPFPSRLQYGNITKFGGVEDAFTIWNPTNLGGGYGVGRFEQYANISGNYLGTYGTRNFIESGEAFFIAASAMNGSIIIKEGDKITGSANVSRLGVSNPTLAIDLFTKANDNTEYKADGTLLNFDPSFSNSINNEDVKKFSNANDNISILKSNTKLFVERRSNLAYTDTIFLSLTNTRIASYRFKINPSVLGNLPLNTFLKDKFLGTETSLSLSSVTNVNFSITSETESQVADRFMIVFEQAIPNGQLTGNFMSIAVDKNADNTNALKWSYSNELNIAQYSIERSKNGTAFTGVGNQNAENVSTLKSYTFNDANNGSDYYRVKATSTTGQVQYSNTVKIIETNVNPVFVVWPNPIENKTMRIFFENLQGNHSLKLMAKQGANVYSAQITVSSAKEVKNIGIGNGVAAGFYNLVLINKAGKSLIQKVFVQ